MIETACKVSHGLGGFPRFALGLGQFFKGCGGCATEGPSAKNTDLSTAKNLLDLKGCWQRQDNHENF